MKKLFLFAISLFFAMSIAYGQTAWEKYIGNPVLEPGPVGEWDDESVMAGCVLLDGDLYHMWYSGFDGMNYRIGHALSEDGITWTKDPKNPALDLGTVGSWDGTSVYIPCVLKIDDVFHMWYDGAQGWTEMIGHATSDDGSIWTKDPMNPVITTGPIGSWDDTQVFPMVGSVIYHDGLFKIWYGGCDETTIWQVGYATSVDGSIWTKDEANNPVLTPGDWGEWDEYSVIPGTILPGENKYEMWYCGASFTENWRIGYATSADGIAWDRFTSNPVIDFGTIGNWDHFQAWCPYVMYDNAGPLYKMWYSGGEFVNSRIGYATSIDVNIHETHNVKNESFQCYPNPSSGALHLRYSISDIRYSIFEVYSADGVKVKTLFTGIQLAGEHTMKVDLSNLPDGIYFIRLQAGEDVETAKLVLIK